MRHHDRNRKLGRVRKQRRALLRGLALSLIERGKIKTTEAKAKELRPYVEKLVTKGKTDSVAARRLLAARLGSAAGGRKLAADIAPRYRDLRGGYTRIVKLPPRSGDAAAMAIIEFV